jgi:SAM-dependent methyltransferase
MDRPDWAPAGIDPDTPSAARVYDYCLGGSHNFAADRAVAEAINAAVPEGPLIARANRAFLHRAVRYLISAGIRQFLDIGSGIPTAVNVHEVAQRAAPGARVVYVDLDPVAVAHSQAMLAGNPDAAAVHADARHPRTILAHRQVRSLLNFNQPIAVMLVAVLHLIGDADDPAGITAQLADAVVPGSYLAISHLTGEGRPEEDVAKVEESIGRTATPLTVRTRAQIAEMFAGLGLVEPGLVWVPLWHPDSPGDLDGFDNHPERSGVLGGIGHKA